MARRIVPRRGTDALWRMDESAGNPVRDTLAGDRELTWPKVTLAHWKLDDNAADTVVLDSYGGHDGTLVGGNNTQDLSVPAVVNRGLDFDGSADLVDIPYSAKLVTPHMSACAWVKLDTNVAWAGVYSLPYAFGSWSDPYATFALRANDLGGDKVSALCAVNGVLKRVSGTTTLLTDGTTYFLVATYDGTDLKVYLDSVLENTLNAPGVLTQASNCGPCIGARSGSSPLEWVDGTIDEVRVFNYALSQTEINTLFNAGAGTDVELPELDGPSPGAVVSEPFAYAREFTGTEYLVGSAPAYAAGAVVSVDVSVVTTTPGTIIDTISGNTGFRMELVDANTVNFTVGVVGGYTRSENCVVGSTLTSGGFHRLRVEYDGLHTRLYQNGDLVHDKEWPGDVDIAAAAERPCNVGRKFDGTAYHTGWLAELALNSARYNLWEHKFLVAAVSDPVAGFAVEERSVGVYNFDGDTGATVDDDAGSNPGSVVGSIERVPGPIGSVSYDFGTGDANGHLEIPHDAAFLTSEGLSVEVWFTPASIGTEQFIVDKKAPADAVYPWRMYIADDGYLWFRSSYFKTTKSNVPVVPGELIHAMGIIDSGSGAAALVVNGASQGKGFRVITAGSQISQTFNSSPIWVGNDSNDSAHKFSGLIHGLRFTRGVKRVVEARAAYDGSLHQLRGPGSQF